jgi:hypothetical protein
MQAQTKHRNQSYTNNKGHIAHNEYNAKKVSKVIKHGNDFTFYVTLLMLDPLAPFAFLLRHTQSVFLPWNGRPSFTHAATEATAVNQSPEAYGVYRKQ